MGVSGGQGSVSLPADEVGGLQDVGAKEASSRSTWTRSGPRRLSLRKPMPSRRANTPSTTVLRLAASRRWRNVLLISQASLNSAPYSESWTNRLLLTGAASRTPRAVRAGSP